MKLAALAFSVLACGLVAAQGTTPDPCAAWALDGYRPNMSKEDALAVRPATKETALSYEVHDPGRFYGHLFFDPSGKLQSYGGLFESPTNASELVSAMKAKFGEPDATDAVVKTMNGAAKVTSWSSPSCEASLSVGEEHQEFEGNDRTLVWVGFQRQSEFEKVEREKALRAKWAANP